MKPGEIVIFRKRKEPCCGVFLFSDGGNLTVFSEEGRKMTVPERKVALATGIATDEKFSDHERKMEMRRLRRELEEAARLFDLKPLWESLADGERAVPFADIVSLYFADADITPEEALKLFWAVDKNKVYFRRERGGYLPLPARCVEKTLLRLKESGEERKREDLSVEWIRSVLDGSPAAPEGFDRGRCVKAVRAYIGNAEDVPDFKSAVKFLAKAGIRDPEAAAEFLIKTGDLPADADPAMLRAGVSEGFSPDALAEASSLLAAEGPAPGFLEDMTGLEAFSIDDETTEDIDDAVSVEISGDEARVGVHIANVALCVAPGGALDREALAAGETMYLPERRADIFPNELIKGRLSLVEGTPRAALSLLMVFDSQTCGIKDFRFRASKIVVRRNMSYRNAERLFESSPEWKQLSVICDSLRRKRVERGAFIVHIPELKIRADSAGNIETAISDTEGISQRVVSELMITANHLSALFLRDRGVPAVFRSQPEPVSAEAKALDPQDPLFPVRVAKLLKPSRIGAVPAWHRSLGVDCYAQMTSPIRRYRDLVVQRQIMSETGGEAGLDEESVLRVIADTETPVHARRVAQRSRKRFWLCEHFRRLGSGAELSATVSRVTDGRVFVYLPEYVSEFPLHGSGKGALREGEPLKVKIRKVDPIRRRLRLVPA